MPTAKSDPFVTPDWLSKHRDEVAVVDVRDEWDFQAGHLPDAVNIPFQMFRDPTDETSGKLPTADRFGSLLGQAGIAPGDTIVAYDDDFGVYASRFLVTAEVYGHEVDALKLLNGDYTAWRRENPVSTEVDPPSSTAYSCQRIDDGPIISAAELEAELGTDAVIVDTRDPIEYDTVHLPGAVNFQWRELVDEAHGSRKSADDCRAVLSRHDIGLHRPVRLYCNTARRLSYVYLVLTDLGHDDVAIYEDGIKSWAHHGGPLETSV